ncbi:MAG: J domain-containing protein [Acidimicrobiales bacterium]
MTPYEVLGVSPNATRAEVAAAYKTLVQIFHPDRYENSPKNVRLEADRRMKELTRAYNLARKGGAALAKEMATQTARTGGAPGDGRSSQVWASPARKPTDQAIKEHKARLRAARAARAQAEQATRRGDARSQAKGRGLHGQSGQSGQAVFGFGQALHSNEVLCRNCRSLQRLPAGWQTQLDHLDYVCGFCGRVVMSSLTWGRVPPRLN